MSYIRHTVLLARLARRRCLVAAVSRLFVALSLSMLALVFAPILNQAKAAEANEPYAAVQSTCLPACIDDLKATASSTPVTASYIKPYEGYTSFSQWQESYDEMVADIGELEESIDGKVEENPGRVSDSLVKRYACTSARADTQSVAALDRVYAEELAIADAMDSEIEEAIAAEEEAAAAYAAKVAPLADIIDTTGWSDDKLDFVLEWAPRIDGYLSGRPACGYGAHFAAAAYDYDVDPRVGPSIAVIESGAGAAMFRSYNMWGWGSSSWGSFEEAIDGWTASFSAGYGYDMDPSDCARYCPGNGGYYGTLSGEMSRI